MLSVGLKGPLCPNVFAVIRLETGGDGNLHAEANSYTRTHTQRQTRPDNGLVVAHEIRRIPCKLRGLQCGRRRRAAQDVPLCLPARKTQ